MSYTIPIDKAGRIVIPKAIRQQIGADASTKFELDVVLDRIELTPIKSPDESKAKLIKKNGRLVIAATGKTFSSAEAIRLDRDDRMEVLASQHIR